MSETPLTNKFTDRISIFLANKFDKKRFFGVFMVTKF